MSRSNYAQYLDFLLGSCYAAELLGKGNLNAALKLLKDNLIKGSALHKEATGRIANLEAVQNRCFVSKKHLEYLRYGLVQ